MCEIFDKLALPVHMRRPLANMPLRQRQMIEDDIGVQAPKRR